MFDIVTIGSATCDVFLKSHIFRVVADKKSTTGKSECFSLGSKIPVDDLYMTTGGAGTNVAVTFARQGFKTAAVIRVGQDANGEAIVNEMKTEGIDSKFVQRDKKNKTSYSVIMIAPTGERTILAYRGTSKALSSKEIPWSKINTRWVYLNSLGGDFSIMEGVVKLKQKTGCYIAWNPGSLDLTAGLNKIKKYLKYIDIFIVNQEEAASLVGISYQDEIKLFKGLDKLIPGFAIMTKGHGGVTASNGQHLWTAGIYKEKYILDRTGAGDSFCSGFVAGLVRSASKKESAVKSFKESFNDKNIEMAIKLGSANGTRVVETIGAKEGLLKKNEINDKRWKNLPIKKINLH